LYYYIFFQKVTYNFFWCLTELNAFLHDQNYVSTRRGPIIRAWPGTRNDDRTSPLKMTDIIVWGWLLKPSVKHLYHNWFTSYIIVYVKYYTKLWLLQVNGDDIDFKYCIGIHDTYIEIISLKEHYDSYVERYGFDILLLNNYYVLLYTIICIFIQYESNQTQISIHIINNSNVGYYKTI